MILVLDIDETMVHTTQHMSKTAIIEDCFPAMGYVSQKRPYLDLFLWKLLQDPDYRVLIWSAGSYDYVHEVVRNIIPDELKHRLLGIMTADDCNEMRDKPLSKVRRMFPGEDIMIIDDREGVTGFDELNHLRMHPYQGEPHDEELASLWEYLDDNRGHPSERLVTFWNTSPMQNVAAAR